jgi:hypothetical protein
VEEGCPPSDLSIVGECLTTEPYSSPVAKKLHHNPATVQSCLSIMNTSTEGHRLKPPTKDFTSDTKIPKKHK